MSRVFIDTSAIYALLVRTDRRHPEAHKAFDKLRARGDVLICTSYVLVETYALLARRVGRAAVRVFRTDIEPLLDIVWVDRDLHETGLDHWLQSRRRRSSLVDAVSFAVIRRHAVDEAFAFDRDFEREGFPRVD